MQVIEKVFPITTNINSQGKLEIGGCDIESLAKNTFQEIFVYTLDFFRRNINQPPATSWTPGNCRILATNSKLICSLAFIEINL